MATSSSELGPAEIIARLAELAEVEPGEIAGRTWRRSVQPSRIPAADLLRTGCGLSRAETAQLLGRSDQAVSDFTTRAERAVAIGGPIRDLITAADAALAPRELVDQRTGDDHEPETIRVPIRHFRSFRAGARLTQHA